MTSAENSQLWYNGSQSPAPSPTTFGSLKTRQPHPDNPVSPFTRPSVDSWYQRVPSPNRNGLSIPNHTQSDILPKESTVQAPSEGNSTPFLGSPRVNKAVSAPQTLSPTLPYTPGLTNYSPSEAYTMTNGLGLRLPLSPYHSWAVEAPKQRWSPYVSQYQAAGMSTPLSTAVPSKGTAERQGGNCTHPRIPVAPPSPHHGAAPSHSNGRIFRHSTLNTHTVSISVLRRKLLPLVRSLLHLVLLFHRVLHRLMH